MIGYQSEQDTKDQGGEKWVEACTTYPKTDKHTCIDMPWGEFEVLSIHG